MQSFASLTVAQRLGLAFGTLLLLLAAVAGVAMFNLRAADGQLTEIVDDRYQKTAIAADIDHAVGAQARFLRNAIIVGPSNPAEAAQWVARSEKEAAANDERFRRLGTMINTPKGRELFDDLVAKRKAYGAARDELTALLKAGWRSRRCWWSRHCPWSSRWRWAS